MGAISVHVDASMARPDNQSSVSRRTAMKQSARVPKSSSNLSESIHQQLNMYALAATAAGAGMLAFVQPSEAKIIYTPTHKTIRVHQHYNLDLNHDGVRDFTIQLTSRWCCTSNGWYAFDTLSAVARMSNGVEGSRVHSSSGPYAFARMRGAEIGPRHLFLGRLMAFAGIDDGFSVFAGPWLNVKNRYLGLKFHLQGKIHYGWARISVVSTRTSITSATLTGYAYETVPNKPIIAGRTKGPDAISIEGPDAALDTPTRKPVSLGLLAIGAPGLSIWRRKETSLGK
jgi:hypothetical protein